MGRLRGVYLSEFDESGAVREKGIAISSNSDGHTLAQQAVMQFANGTSTTKHGPVDPCKPMQTYARLPGLP